MYDPARDIFKNEGSDTQPTTQDSAQQKQPPNTNQDDSARKPSGTSDATNEDSFPVGLSRETHPDSQSPHPQQPRKRGRPPKSERTDTSPRMHRERELAPKRRRNDEEPAYGYNRSASNTQNDAGQLRQAARESPARRRHPSDNYSGDSRYHRDRQEGYNGGERHRHDERRDEGQQNRTRRDRSRSPRRSDQYRSHHRYRSPPRRTPPPLFKDPTPPPVPPPPSPPRQRKRPGQASRFSAAEKEALRKQQEEREREAAAAAEKAAQARGVDEVVRAHYNEKKEYGKEWRTTSSRIKGLRSFNNWIKSVIIQKFGPSPEFLLRQQNHHGGTGVEPLIVLDLGCGKGGDLLKWKNSPHQVELYVGVDAAEVSISQARERHLSMQRELRRNQRLFRGEFFAMDGWTQWIGKLPFLQQVGLDMSLEPERNQQPGRWSPGGNFDVVSMMFCLHYSFESEEKCRGMLRNVVTALKKGGRFFGTIPNSEVIAKHLMKPREKEGPVEWGNSIYKVRFSNPPPPNWNGVFQPPFGWRYSYFLEEAVEEVPEYVVPWEAFRAIAEDFGLEFLWKKPFHDIYREECKGDLAQLSERMGVKSRDGRLLVGEDDWEASGFYIGFAFRRV